MGRAGEAAASASGGRAASGARGGSATGGTGAGESSGGDVGTDGGAGNESGRAGAGMSAGVAGSVNAAGGRAGAGMGKGGVNAVGELGGSSGSEAAGAGSECELTATGAALECSEYTECGCGCCSEPVRTIQARTACYYPERGDDLALITCEDQLEATAARCADQPCVDGLRQVCCATPAQQPATYTARADSDSISVERTRPTGDHTWFYLSPLGSGSNGWPLELPPDWSVGSAGDEDWTWQSLGALGKVALGPGPSCTLDLDFTLFFVAESGSIEPVRFKVSDLPIENMFGCD